jgi:NAD+ synthase (glutamine-hydrolysing)
MFRIALAQINPVVGAFEANVRKINEAYQRACSERARMLLTPELAVCGYPPYDLIDRPEMFERNEKALYDLTASTQSQQCALVVGHVGRNPSQDGRPSQNFVSVLENGKIVFKQAKSLLPTYDVFDEARYFQPAEEIAVWNCDGKRIALAICEDLWGEHQVFGRHLYGHNPVQIYREKQADLIVSISSSPYSWGKSIVRERLHQNISRKLGLPLIYVNQVSATDEILFDGNSFVTDSQGNVLARLPVFEESLGYVDWDESSSDQPVTLSIENWEKQAPAEIATLSKALVTGIQEYFKRTGFKKAIIGLSGGIDSAVVATLAAQALGPENVLGVAMPSQYSSGHSLEDADQLAKNLGIRFEVRPIKFMFSVALRELMDPKGHLDPVAAENLQTRLRGLILMTLSNHEGSLVLTTGNKSELAMGYCTLYGDMVGALDPIGDLFKTRVYELARWINLSWGNPIPERCITKAPSAELRPNQTDQDSLPPYDILDEFLTDYIENNLSILELQKRYENNLDRKTGWVSMLLLRFELSEYKRRQSAISLRVSQKAFGIGRRVPVAKTWDQR